QLRDLAGGNTFLLPLQAFLVQRYLNARDYDRAIAVAQRTSDALPNSADAARIATQTYAAADRLADSLLAAGAWRRRSLDNPFPADLWIAEANVRLGRGEPAVAALEPYRAGALAKPEAASNPHVLGIYLRGLLLANRDND